MFVPSPEVRRPRRRASSLALLVLIAAVTGLPFPAALSAASPTPSTSAPSLIHGAGSDDGALVTLAGSWPQEPTSRSRPPSRSVTGSAQPGTTTLAPTTSTGSQVAPQIAIAGSPASCTAWGSETQPPTTIRVYRTRTDTVEELDFHSYVQKVVVNEFSRTWAFQLLAVGAIVAKQNAWYWSMRGREWSNLLTWGGRTHPIQRVTLGDGSIQWQTTDASSSGAGLCWDLTDNPGIDQCYDCGGSPVDPATGPRNQAALEATWRITLRRPRSGTQSFFAPGYAGRKSATCPSMATQAEWESWFTGAIDFNQAGACVSQNGESVAMLLRRFLSSYLEIRDPSRADLTGDGFGDVPILRLSTDGGTTETLAFDPATADPAYESVVSGFVPPPVLGADPGIALARAVGRLDRTDVASLVTVALDPASSTVSVVAASLDGPGAIRSTTWWSGTISGLDPASTFSLAIADITGDMRSDVVLLERARASDGTWWLRLRALSTTDTGPNAAGFVTWAESGPFALPTRFERLGDIDYDGRLDLVYAPGDSSGFLVRRAVKDGHSRFGSAEPYGSLTLPANPDDWRYFALADVRGIGLDEPVIGATGATAEAAVGSPVALALLDAVGNSYPVKYPFTVAAPVVRWSGQVPALGNALLWTGDAGGDGRADAAIVNEGDGAIASIEPVQGAASLALVSIKDGGTPPSLPRLGPGALANIRIVAPSDQRTLSADSSLRALAVSTGTVRGAFDSTTGGYLVLVPRSVTSIKVRPTATRPWARITVAGSIVRSGTLSRAIALNVGSNRIRIVVRDADASSTYTITVLRADRPPAPRVTKLVALTTRRARVSWTPSGTGGSAITTWVVRYRLAGTTKWTTVVVANPAARSWTVSGLRLRKTYEFQVLARNLVGLGAGSPRVKVLVSK